MNGSGKWAVITGASSGIGRALALEFASGGFNVFLAGRNQTALQAVAARCLADFKVEAEIFSADLAKAEGIDSLAAALNSNPRNYEALVNNAGFGIHGDFAHTDIELEIQMLNVQLAAALKLTKVLLPGMIARRSGKILNVASVYSFAPVPFQSVYSACKAFLLSFSSSLRNELVGTGVDVTVFCPGITQTQFRSRAGIGEKSKESGMTAEAAARVAYVAVQRGQFVVVPGFMNRLFVFVAGLLPTSSFTSLMRFINRQRGHQTR